MIVTHKGKTIGLATSQEMADRIIHEYLEELKGEVMESKEDLVNSPNHYTKYKKIKGEVIDLIEEVTSHYPKEVVYHIGNALKYLLRAPFKKNMIQDLEKAIYHLKRAVERLK